MAGFIFSHTHNHKSPIIRRLYVPTATALDKGEPIDFTQGTGVIVLASPTNLTTGIHGVTNEPHAANDGYYVDVVTDPDAIFKCRETKTYTLTGGSTGTAVDSSLLPQTNSFFKGGAIQIVSCAADSTLNGKIVKISDSTGSSGTLTLAETLPNALASGDTIRIVPGELAYGHVGYDLDSDATSVDYDTSGGSSIMFVGSSPSEMVGYWKFVKHLQGNAIS